MSVRERGLLLCRARRPQRRRQGAHRCVARLWAACTTLALPAPRAPAPAARAPPRQPAAPRTPARAPAAPPRPAAQTTHDVACLSRWMAADLYLKEVDALRFELSMSHASDEVRRA